MSIYKEQSGWIDALIASTIVLLTAAIAVLPPPKASLGVTALAVLAVLIVLAMLRDKRVVFWLFVAAGVAAGVLFGGQAWLTNVTAGLLLGAGAWLALWLCLIAARVVLWPVIWLAQHIGFGSARVQRGSYASPSPRRYTAPAPRHYSAPAGYSGAGYAAAGAAAGYAAGGQAWDMLDPMNAANPLSPPPPMHETLSPFPTDNTNGLPMISGTMVDTTGHAYGDPAPIFEPAPVIYDYAPTCDYSNNNFGGACGGGFDF